MTAGTRRIKQLVQDSTSHRAATAIAIYPDKSMQQKNVTDFDNYWSINTPELTLNPLAFIITPSGVFSTEAVRPSQYELTDKTSQSSCFWQLTSLSSPP